MKLPLQLTFRNMESSPALELKVHDLAEKLDQVCDCIMSCRVVVEADHKHRNKGNLFHVRIDITVPDQELVVSREPHQHQAHQDAYVAIRDAFQAARRQLETYRDKRKQHVKTHEGPPHGRIGILFPAEDYGRITTLDGREIYFHRNSVVNGDFDKLEEGMEVRFNEVQGDEGPQASTVQVVGRIQQAAG